MIDEVDGVGIGGGRDGLRLATALPLADAQVAQPDSPAGAAARAAAEHAVLHEKDTRARVSEGAILPRFEQMIIDKDGHCSLRLVALDGRMHPPLCRLWRQRRAGGDEKRAHVLRLTEIHLTGCEIDDAAAGELHPFPRAAIDPNLQIESAAPGQVDAQLGHERQAALLLDQAVADMQIVIHVVDHLRQRIDEIEIEAHVRDHVIGPSRLQPYLRDELPLEMRAEPERPLLQLRVERIARVVLCARACRRACVFRESHPTRPASGLLTLPIRDAVAAVQTGVVKRRSAQRGMAISAPRSVKRSAGAPNHGWAPARFSSSAGARQQRIVIHGLLAVNVAAENVRGEFPLPVASASAASRSSSV